MTKQKPFGKLTASQKIKIIKAHKIGLLEVNCPWWNKNHWEEKSSNSPLWDEAYYRIKTDK